MSKIKTARCLHLSHILSMGNPWKMLVYIVKRLQGNALSNGMPCVGDYGYYGRLMNYGFTKAYCESDSKVSEVIFKHGTSFSELPEVFEDVTMGQSEKPLACEVIDED